MSIYKWWDMIVLCDDGDEVSVTVAASDLIEAASDAMQEARERGLRPTQTWEEQA